MAQSIPGVLSKNITLPGLFYSDDEDVKKATIAMYAMQRKNAVYQQVVGNQMQIRVATKSSELNYAMKNVPRRAYLLYKDEHFILQRK